jgi:hypothetical protein
MHISDTDRIYHQFIMDDLNNAVTNGDDLRYLDTDGLVHRDHDLPAICHPDGTQQWFQHGVAHRDGDQPAYIDPHCCQWIDHGRLSRDVSHGPAYIETRPDGTVRIEWYYLDMLIDRVEPDQMTRYRVFRLVSGSESLHDWRRFRSLQIDSDEIEEALSDDQVISHLRKRWFTALISEKTQERERIYQQLTNEINKVVAQAERFGQLGIGYGEKRGGSDLVDQPAKRMRS